MNLLPSSTYTPKPPTIDIPQPIAPASPQPLIPLLHLHFPFVPSHTHYLSSYGIEPPPASIRIDRGPAAAPPPPPPPRLLTDRLIEPCFVQSPWRQPLPPSAAFPSCPSPSSSSSSLQPSSWRPPEQSRESVLSSPSCDSNQSRFLSSPHPLLRPTGP